MGTSRSRVEERGMTLIEVMMAVAVIAFSFSVVYGSLVTMFVLGRANEDRVRAVVAVSSLLEEAQALDTTSMAEYIAPEIDAPGVDHWVEAEVMVPDGDEMVAVALPLEKLELADLPNPVEMRVTLYWQDNNGRTYHYRASTMKGR